MSAFTLPTDYDLRSSLAIAEREISEAHSALASTREELAEANAATDEAEDDLSNALTQLAKEQENVEDLEVHVEILSSLAASAGNYVDALREGTKLLTADLEELRRKVGDVCGSS